MECARDIKSLVGIRECKTYEYLHRRQDCQFGSEKKISRRKGYGCGDSARIPPRERRCQNLRTEKKMLMKSVGDMFAKAVNERRVHSKTADRILDSVRLPLGSIVMNVVKLNSAWSEKKGSALLPKDS